MAMVATDTATAMDTTARGKLRLQLLPNPDMATTVTMARGRLKPLLWLRLSPRLLPNLATDTTVMDMAMDMATEDTDMGMAMDTTAKGLQMLDTMAMVATAMAMVTDMAMDMDTMDKKED